MTSKSKNISFQLTKLFSLTLQTIKLVYVSASTLRQLPFQPEKWKSDLKRHETIEDEQNQRIRVKKNSPRSLRQFFYYLNMLQLYIYASYISFQFYLRMKDGKLNAGAALHFIKLTTVGTSCLVHLTIVISQAEVVAFINGIDHVRMQMRSEGMHTANWWEHFVSAAPILAVFSYGCILPPFYAILLPLFPENTMFISSIFPTRYHSNPLVIILLVIHEFFNVLAAFISCEIIMCIVWSYFMNLLSWLPKLKEYKTKDVNFKSGKIPSLYMKMKIFQELFVLSNLLNVVLFILMSSMIFGITGLTTICLYVTISGHSVFPIEIYLLFVALSAILLFVIIVTFSQLGQIRDISKNMIPLFKIHVNLETVRDAMNIELLENFQTTTKGHIYTDERFEEVGCSSSFKRNTRSSSRYDRRKEMSQMQKCLIPFGIRILTVYCTLKTPHRLIEQIFTLFILLLSLNLKLTG